MSAENLGRIVKVVDVITAALKKGNKILLFGNGGSAADAQHLAAEFVNRFLIETAAASGHRPDNRQLRPDKHWK